MRTLVTGATGFIGTNLVRRLVEQGESVRILRRGHSDTRGLDGLPIETALGDVRHLDSVREAVDGCRRVYHLAARLNVASSDWNRFYRTNVLGTENVCRAALEAGVERLLHCSTVAVIGWGPRQAPATEETEFDFDRFKVPYIHTKRQAETVVQESVQRGLSAIIVNPTYVFGPWDKRLGANRLVYLVATGKLRFCPGKGGINMVDVEDVVSGMISAMERGRVGERYILGGENLFFRELFALIAELAGQPPPLGIIPLPVLWTTGAFAEIASRLFGVQLGISRSMARIAQIPHFVSCEKAMRELGYRYRPARDVIRRSLDWLRHEGLLPRLAPEPEEAVVESEEAARWKVQSEK